MIIVSQDRKEVINFNYAFNLNILTGKTKQVINIDGHKLGEYKTEKKAAEVLKEIIRFYEISEKYKCINSITFPMFGIEEKFVYKMPEE